MVKKWLVYKSHMYKTHRHTLSYVCGRIEIKVLNYLLDIFFLYILSLPLVILIICTCIFLGREEVEQHLCYSQSNCRQSNKRLLTLN